MKKYFAPEPPECGSILPLVTAKKCLHSVCGMIFCRKTCFAGGIFNKQCMRRISFAKKRLHIARAGLYYNDCGNILTAGNRGGNIVPVEESPDCTEQGVHLKRWMPQTIFCGKTSATESKPLPVSGSKGERVGQEPTGRQ